MTHRTLHRQKAYKTAYADELEYVRSQPYWYFALVSFQFVLCGACILGVGLFLILWVCSFRGPATL